MARGRALWNAVLRICPRRAEEVIEHCLEYTQSRERLK